jgi:hypothetical protein
MTTYSSVKSQKTKLFMGTGTGSPETYTLIGGITDIGAPEASTSEIDNTDLESDAKEFVAGITDYGSFTAQMKYQPNNPVHQDLEELALSHEVRNFRILYSDGKTKKEFAAFVKSYNPAAAVDGLVKGPLSLRITGVVTTTYPS